MSKSHHKINEYGTQFWYITKSPNHQDKPNVFWDYEEYLLHREDGPAVIDFNGSQKWYLFDQIINCNSQEEFEKLMKLKVFW